VTGGLDPRWIGTAAIPEFRGIFIAVTGTASFSMMLQETAQAGLGLLTAAAGIPTFLWMRVKVPLPKT
jgi:hypothetical protein